MQLPFSFYSNSQKLVFGGFVLLLILIPVGSYVLSQRFKTPAPIAPNKPVTRNVDTSTTNIDKKTSLDEIKKLSEDLAGTSSSGTVATLALGPTLNFTIALEGRAKNSQNSRVFVGIASGSPTSQPQYLLSFTVDLPLSGAYKGLSLAGLNVGSLYTAYIKGPSQIATASAFTISPTETNLNGGETLTLLSGDLNEDNQINSSDYQILIGVLGTTAKSPNWNSRADINFDGVVNSADLSYIIKNLGKAGSSGTWISTPPAASGSAQPQGGEGNGYWLWVPSL